MAPTIEQIEAMSDDEIRAEYNKIAEHTVVGLESYREELRRRTLDRQTGALVNLTKVLTVLTAVNVVLVAVTVIA